MGGVGGIVFVIPFFEYVERALLDVFPDEGTAQVVGRIQSTELGRWRVDFAEHVGLLRVPVSVAFTVGLLVVEHEYEFFIELLVYVKHVGGVVHQSVGCVFDGFVERGSGLGVALECELYLGQEGPCRDICHSGFFSSGFCGEQGGCFCEVGDEQTVHLLFGTARYALCCLGVDYIAGDGHHSEGAVEVEIEP